MRHYIYLDAPLIFTQIKGLTHRARDKFLSSSMG